MKINDKFSIVVQGNFDPMVYNQYKYIDHYLQYVQKVIISCYENNDTSSIQIENNDRFILVKSPVPTHPYNPCNAYVHAYSSYHGAKLVDTEFMIKIRSDEFYHQVDKIIDKVEQKPDGYITCNLSSPMIRVRVLQPGDHFMGGKTKYLREQFRLVMEWLSHFSEYADKHNHFSSLNNFIGLPYNPGGNAETTMFFAFLKAKNADLKPIYSGSHKDIYEFMKKHIDIININDLLPITWSAHPGDPSVAVYYNYNQHVGNGSDASSLEELGKGL